jgi:hypothetical protein
MNVTSEINNEWLSQTSKVQKSTFFSRASFPVKAIAFSFHPSARLSSLILTSDARNDIIRTRRHVKYSCEIQITVQYPLRIKLILRHHKAFLGLTDLSLGHNIMKDFSSVIDKNNFTDYVTGRRNIINIIVWMQMRWNNETTIISFISSRHVSLRTRTLKHLVDDSVILKLMLHR